MRHTGHFIIVFGSLLASSCGSSDSDKSCERLSRAEALQMALDAKSAMLRRSTDEYSTNYDGQHADFVRIGTETNGYAANIGFKGKDGRTLIALIEADCFIGWTEGN